MLHKEATRQAWKLDSLVLGLWAFWLIWLSSIDLATWLDVSGLSWILLYAAWRWTWVQAALFFLLLGWFFRSLSLMPSGLFWLSLFLVYSVLRLGRLRIMIRNAHQFALATFATSLFLFFVQLFLLSRIYPGEGLSWILLLRFLINASAHAFIGFFLYLMFDRLVDRR